MNTRACGHLTMAEGQPNNSMIRMLVQSNMVVTLGGGGRADFLTRSLPP